MLSCYLVTCIYISEAYLLNDDEVLFRRERELTDILLIMLTINISTIILKNKIRNSEIIS